MYIFTIQIWERCQSSFLLLSKNANNHIYESIQCSLKKSNPIFGFSQHIICFAHLCCCSRQPIPWHVTWHFNKQGRNFSEGQTVSGGHGVPRSQLLSERISVSSVSMEEKQFALEKLPFITVWGSGVNTSQEAKQEANERSGWREERGQVREGAKASSKILCSMYCTLWTPLPSFEVEKPKRD